MNAPRFLLTVVALFVAGAGSASAGGHVYGGVTVGVGAGPYWGGGGYYGRPYWGGGYYGRPYWGGGYYGRPYYGGVYFPGPYLYPGPIVAPYYDPPSVVVVPAQPQVYIEQSGAAVEPAPEASQYWYYCHAARNYYPYVKECPGGWQKVPPRPAQ